MLALNRSLLNTEYTHKCSADFSFYQFLVYLHVTFPKHYQTYFTWLTKGIMFFFSSSPHPPPSSSIHSTTLGGFRSVQQFYSTPVYPQPSPSNQQFSSSLCLLLPGPSTLTSVFRLVLFCMASILLFFFCSSCILITRVAHLSICDFINFIISSCLILYLNSIFILILHEPSGFCVGP